MGKFSLFLSGTSLKAKKKRKKEKGPFAPLIVWCGALLQLKCMLDGLHALQSFYLIGVL